MLLARNRKGDDVLHSAIALLGTNHPIVKDLLKIAYIEHTPTEPGQHLPPFEMGSRSNEKKIEEADEELQRLQAQRERLKEVEMKKSAQ